MAIIPRWLFFLILRKQTSMNDLFLIEVFLFFIFFAMTPLNTQTLTELRTDERKTIIQNLWKPLDDFPWIPSQDCPNINLRVQSLIATANKNPLMIPTIRYELEEYTNDLNPNFSPDFLEQNKWAVVRILDIGAWPGDVTVRCFQKLDRAGLIPQIFAVESSPKFRQDILKNAQKFWIASQQLWSISETFLESWIYPIDNSSIEELSSENISDISLLIWNYVLDRIGQKSLVNTLIQSWIPNVQFTNCIPLQYQNPTTGQSYLAPEEIIIPEWALNLESLWQALRLQTSEEFSGKNIVTSLQDGSEYFDYAGIRGKQTIS